MLNTYQKRRETKMKNTMALIFGYNEYGLEIAKNIESVYSSTTIFRLDNTDPLIDKNTNLKIEDFDLSDDWNSLIEKYDLDNCIVFCSLENVAKNIFLTISLRSAFPDLFIVALTDNNESANKLRMAGASKVIPIVETTAHMITDMLKKPIITKVLHDILYEDSDLKIEQIKISNADFFDGKYPADIEWSRDHCVLVVAVTHEDGSSEFIYSSKTKHHLIKNGDIFIVVGYEADIKEFEKLVGVENEN